jgi:hypothetical protein
VALFQIPPTATQTPPATHPHRKIRIAVFGKAQAKTKVLKASLDGILLNRRWKMEDNFNLLGKEGQSKFFKIRIPSC